MSMQPDLIVLERMVARITGALPHRIEPLVGGASTRRYFRVGMADGSAVAMFVPEGAKPEEATPTERAECEAGPAPRWPFLEVLELLAERGIRVPRLLAEDCDRGWLLLEDLGDETLANFVLRSPSRREEVYRKAVADLAEAQRSLAELPARSVVGTRAFDAPLLRWELDHGREWALDARGLPLPDDDRAAFDAIAERLSNRIAALPRGFVHRDYQSRNLMVREPQGELELVWIDFQDALLGPRVYDLVALLNDSYQSFEPAFQRARIRELAAGLGLATERTPELEREFDWVTVQRKLKDAGRFVYIDRVKGDPSFLPFVEPTLVKARAAIARLAPTEPDMRQLQAILDRRLGPQSAVTVS